ncbi:MAG: hypothetical protein ACOYOE_01315 [Chlorobium sp.]
MILTEVCPEQCHLLVNFSSIYEGIYYDDAFVVNIGEHPFIKHPSYIEYRLAAIDKASHLLKCADSGYFMPKESVSTELYSRICNGLMISAHTPKRIKKYFADNKGR